MDWKNRLYFGDNLDILRREVPDASVDLIYLDPPFNSNATDDLPLEEKATENALHGLFDTLPRRGQRSKFVTSWRGRHVADRNQAPRAQQVSRHKGHDAG